jgi:hypothetical protein
MEIRWRSSEGEGLVVGAWFMVGEFNTKSSGLMIGNETATAQADALATVRRVLHSADKRASV